MVSCSPAIWQSGHFSQRKCCGPSDSASSPANIASVVSNIRKGLLGVQECSVYFPISLVVLIRYNIGLIGLSRDELLFWEFGAIWVTVQHIFRASKPALGLGYFKICNNYERIL